MSFITMLKKIDTCIDNGIGTYFGATQIAQDKIVSVSTTVGINISKTTIQVVNKIRERAPMIKMPSMPSMPSINLPFSKQEKKEEVETDVLTQLACDEQLAAALRYINANPTVAVSITVIEEEAVASVSKSVNCDGRAPMAKVKDIKGNIGMPKVNKVPGKKGGIAKMKSFVNRFTSTKLATCIINN